MSLDSKLYKTDEAIKLVRNAPSGVQFLLRVRNNAPVDGDRYFPGALSGYVKISRKEAIRFIHGSIGEVLEEKGARFPLAINDKDYWLGA